MGSKGEPPQVQRKDIKTREKEIQDKGNLVKNQIIQMTEQEEPSSLVPAAMWKAPADQTCSFFPYFADFFSNCADLSF